MSQNTLLMPFLGFLRNLLDCEETKDVIPMFDAFAKDVERMSIPMFSVRDSYAEIQVEDFSMYPNQLACALGLEPVASPDWSDLLKKVETLLESRESATKVGSPSVILPEKGCPDAPVINLNRTWDYSFHPDLAKTMFYDACYGKSNSDICADNPHRHDCITFLKEREPLIKTVRRLSAGLSRDLKIDQLYKKWMEAYEAQEKVKE